MAGIKGGFIEETGNKYGNFKVLRRDLTCERPIKWICQCLKCKKVKSVAGTTLRFGKGKSCKCTKRKVSVDTRKNKVNDKFFETQNLLNSYWAGFIAADGYVTGNLLGIQLAEKDLLHLEKFKFFVQSNTKIETEVKVVTKTKSFKSYKIRFRSEKIVNDLLNNFNITEKKSLTLEYPQFSDKNCEDAFILGYIDGDGCISLEKTKSFLKIRISVIGTENILTSIQKRFNEILGLTEVGSIVKMGNIYRLSVYGKKSRNLFKYFYSKDLPKLERKWKKEYYRRINEENKL